MARGERVFVALGSNLGDRAQWLTLARERLAALPGFARLHPLQEEDGAQGALELMWRLQEILAEVTGLDAVSLQPAAGSQGEVTGLMLARAYFAAQGVEAFYPSVSVMFLVKDASAHYHVPLLLSPYGFSTYRGS